MRKNDIFRFKKFEVSHQVNAQKVSTDSVLLGSWADIVSANRILDIGTGCGILALMSAQRNPSAEILAVEINQSFAEEAESNFSRSIFSNRIKLIQIDIKELKENLFDHIICNPPYFSNSLKSSESNRNMARHDVHLDFESLSFVSKKLLIPNGKISMVLPEEIHLNVIGVFERNHFDLTRICKVKHQETSNPSLILVEFISGVGEALKNTELIIKNEYEYNAEYKTLLEDFLVIF